MTQYDVDLFVIGGGSGGVRAGRIAAGYGAKVAIAEEYRVGGTCVIRGCVPKKLYVYAGRFSDSFEEAAGFGWTVGEASFDFARLKDGKDKEILRLEGAYKSNSRARRRDADPHPCGDRGSPHGVSGGRNADDRGTILVATGGHPFLPETIPGIHLAENSNDLFEWTSLPRSVVVVGGGYIAVEFASALARMGSEVTIVIRREKVLRGFDEDLRSALTEQMLMAGIRIVHGTDVVSLDGRPGNISATLMNGDAIAAERVLYATGRLPNTGGLGLDRVGVALDAMGAVKVDSFSRSSVPSIYAVGDVTDRVNLTPVAIREGHAFADTVFGKTPVEVDHRSIADRGILHARNRHHWPFGTGRPARARRNDLQDELPADEGDAVRQQGAHADEACCRRQDGPRARRAHPGRRRGRNGAVPRHRDPDGSHEAGFRRRPWRCTPRLPKNWSPCARPSRGDALGGSSPFIVMAGLSRPSTTPAG